MYYIYVLQSIPFPGDCYIGLTTDLKTRLKDHNNGKSPHTSKFLPWRLDCYTAITEEKTAYAFEKYLKSHSGRTFAKKRLRGYGALDKQKAVA